jgi:hypothetical protein
MTLNQHFFEKENKVNLDLVKQPEDISSGCFVL